MGYLNLGVDEGPKRFEEDQQLRNGECRQVTTQQPQIMCTLFKPLLPADSVKPLAAWLNQGERPLSASAPVLALSGQVLLKPACAPGAPGDCVKVHILIWQVWDGPQGCASPPASKAVLVLLVQCLHFE